MVTNHNVFENLIKSFASINHTCYNAQYCDNIHSFMCGNETIGSKAHNAITKGSAKLHYNPYALRNSILLELSAHFLPLIPHNNCSLLTCYHSSLTHC